MTSMVKKKLYKITTYLGGFWYSYHSFYGPNCFEWTEGFQRGGGGGGGGEGGSMVSKIITFI